MRTQPSVRTISRLASIAAYFLLPPLTFAANTWTWTGGDSNWNNNAANWSSNHVPFAGEDVVINNATVELTNDTPILKSLSVTNNAKLRVYSAPTNGATPWGLLVNVTGNLSIAGSSWIYPHSHNTNGGSAWFLCSNLVVDATSGFNANTQGYGSLSAAFNPGYGPGGGAAGQGSGGGGYGGKGGGAGVGATPNAGGSTYGSYTNPVDPGSASGGSGYPGQAGGGLIRVLAADSVVMDGSLLANGQGDYGYSGAGSGGGICIQCKTFQGSGVLSAVGGNGTRGDNRFGAAGGGGRIAVVYDTGAQAGVSSQPTVTFNAAGGTETAAALAIWETRRGQGRPGSLHLSDNQFFNLDRVLGGAIMVPGVTSLTTNTLSLSQGMVAFPSGFTLAVSGNVNLTAGGGLDMTNSVANIGGLVINSDNRGNANFHGGPSQQVTIGSDLSITKGWIEIADQGIVNVGGNLVLTNGGLAYLYGGVTNGGPTSYGMLVNVGGDITIATNCWVYPYSNPTNGGSVFLKAASFTARMNAGIDATGLGFGGAVVNSVGYGPGAPSAGAGSGTGGAGYGGMGGWALPFGFQGPWPGGPTYGSSNAPIDPGSGGSGYNNYSGKGGGLIHLDVAGTVIVDGSLLANGTIPSSYASSGSGGGIYISCRRFQGAVGGQLTANGGAGWGGGGQCGGGGGGGRIAVWSLKSTNEWLGVVQANGGAGATYAAPGTNGTIFWGRLRDQGTIFVVH